jgi:hypothetical protein
MNATQIAFPFRTKPPQLGNAPNTDLIGCSYCDGRATMTVTSVCLGDVNRVLVQRDLDGRIWSMPAWLMRLIFMEKNGKRAAKILPRFQESEINAMTLLQIEDALTDEEELAQQTEPTVKCSWCGEIIRLHGKELALAMCGDCYERMLAEFLRTQQMNQSSSHASDR